MVSNLEQGMFCLAAVLRSDYKDFYQFLLVEGIKWQIYTLDGVSGILDTDEIEPK